MKKYLILAVFLMSACQAKQEEDSFGFMGSPELKAEAPVVEEIISPEEEANPDLPPPPQQVPTTNPRRSENLKPQPAKPIERQIIRNASLSFQVTSVSESSKHIESAVKTLGGIVANSEEIREGAELRQNLSIKIPAAKLDTFLVLLLKESIYTERKSISAEDVTKRYLDMTARIKAKKATEEKYLEILKKARNVEEVLKVEEQLGVMREDIEAREAQLRELKNDVAMSHVNASFYEKTESIAAPDAPFYVKIWNSFTDGFELLSSFFLGIFYFLPLLCLIIFVGWLAVRWWRKRRL
jgi:Domain of unknown function (DUF4349)